MDIGSIIDILTRLVLGFGTGFAIGLTGIGAGVLVIPSLIYIIGLPAVGAVGTGLVYSSLARVYGVFEHLRLRNVRKRTAFYIAIGGVPAVILTAFIINRLAPKVLGDRIDSIMKMVIGIVMLMTWTLMLVNIIRCHRSNSEDYYVPLKEFPLRRKLYGVATGIGVGILIGATSTGGGILLVPILVATFKLSPKNTVGTSVLISITMSGVGALSYYMLGGGSNVVNLAVAVTMFIGSIPGVSLGSRTAVRIPHKALSIILLAVITIGVISMFIGIKH